VRRIVTEKLLATLKNYEHRLRFFTRFASDPIPGSVVAFNSHRQRQIDEDEFIRRHIDHLYKVQHHIVTHKSKNPFLRTMLPIFAKPIMAGFDPRTKSFVSISELPQNAKGFPDKNISAMQFAALEKALSNLWSYSGAFKVLPLSTIFITEDDISGFSVIFTDPSQVIQTPTARAAIFSSKTPFNIGQEDFDSLYRGETIYGDVKLLDRLLNRLAQEQMHYEVVLNDARRRVWKRQ
jgi:hypothetical protein